MRIIRPAVGADAVAIAAIYGQVVRETTISFEFEPPSADEMASRIRAVTATYPWLVAVRADEVEGYAYASRHRERDGYASSVDVSAYVREGARGLGVGSALYSDLFGELERDKLYHRAYAGIALPNDASVALHRKFGFELVGVYREVGYKFGRWIDVGWWERDLGGSLSNLQTIRRRHGHGLGPGGETVARSSAPANAENTE